MGRMQIWGVNKGAETSSKQLEKVKAPHLHILKLSQKSVSSRRNQTMQMSP